MISDQLHRAQQRLMSGIRRTMFLRINVTTVFFLFFLCGMDCFPESLLPKLKRAKSDVAHTSSRVLKRSKMKWHEGVLEFRAPRISQAEINICSALTRTKILHELIVTFIVAAQNSRRAAGWWNEGDTCRQDTVVFKCVGTGQYWSIIIYLFIYNNTFLLCHIIIVIVFFFIFLKKFSYS